LRHVFLFSHTNASIVIPSAGTRPWRPETPRGPGFNTRPETVISSGVPEAVGVTLGVRVGVGVTLGVLVGVSDGVTLGDLVAVALGV
jgi:hypothetical protein